MADSVFLRRIAGFVMVVLIVGCAGLEPHSHTFLNERVVEDGNGNERLVVCPKCKHQFKVPF